MTATRFLAVILIAATAALMVTEASVAENRDGVAVIIGNKTYKNRDVPTVSFAHNDAEAMKRYVVDVLGYREGNVIDLRDARSYVVHFWM